jgi:hypothetical protein
MLPGAWGFLQAVHQWSNLGSARVRHQQPSNWERCLFKLFQLAPQPLAVFIQLLQGFITIHEIMIRGFTKLRVMNALASQFFELILKYLSIIGLPVHDVLQVSLRCLQLVNTCFKLCRQLNTASNNNKASQ